MLAGGLGVELEFTDFDGSEISGSICLCWSSTLNAQLLLLGPQLLLNTVLICVVC